LIDDLYESSFFSVTDRRRKAKGKKQTPQVIESAKKHQLMSRLNFLLIT